jgi:16S rRNA (cytosine1402-N4)-methyltransferase
VPDALDERDGEPQHVPVMVGEVTRLLAGRRLVMDMTVGLGGHARALLDAGVQRVVGVDRDPEAISIAARTLAPYGSRFKGVVGSFSEQPTEPVDGVLYDLGVSSLQLDRPERGFAYRNDGPLDMRMAPEGPSARDVVNDSTEEELGRLILEFGEERYWRRIAGAIGRARSRAPIETTGQLARVVASAVPRRGRAAPHPARRTFQALRIAVNRELEELAVSLPRTVEFLAPGGRIVVIAYHSLEDRIVKRFILGEERLTPLTKKPLRATPSEVAANPRARSGRLRSAERLLGSATGADEDLPR